MGRRYAEAGSGQDCPAAPGSGDYGTEESGRTGDFPDWHGYLYETDQGLHGKIVGPELHGTTGLHHQAPARALYL